jgi:hypothetical protein
VPPPFVSPLPQTAVPSSSSSCATRFTARWPRHNEQRCQSGPRHRCTSHSRRKRNSLLGQPRPFTSQSRSSRNWPVAHPGPAGLPAHADAPSGAGLHNLLEDQRLGWAGKAMRVSDDGKMAVPESPIFQRTAQRQRLRHAGKRGQIAARARGDHTVTGSKGGSER